MMLEIWQFVFWISDCARIRGIYLWILLGFLMDFWILMMQIYCKILDLQFLEYWCLNPLFDASL
jgi:hypothetical protein